MLTTRMYKIMWVWLKSSVAPIYQSKCLVLSYFHGTKQFHNLRNEMGCSPTLINQREMHAEFSHDQIWEENDDHQFVHCKRVSPSIRVFFAVDSLLAMKHICHNYFSLLPIKIEEYV